MLNKVLTVALEYGMLICICGFIFSTMRMMFKDLKQAMPKEIPIRENAKNQVSLVVLETLDSKLENKKISFSSQISIGRGSENDIVLDDIYVSHHHAIISPVRNLFQIEDLESRNHTYVNGKILKGKAYLQNGDTIKIGCVTFRFER